MQQHLRYIMIGGLTVLALTGCTPTPVDQEASSEGTAQEQATGLTVEITEDMRYEDGLYSVQLQKVSIRLQNPHLATELENAINNESDQLAAEVIQLRKELVGETDAEGNPIYENEYFAVSELVSQYSDEDMISLVMNYYMYTGGAHGLYYSVGYNHDIITGQQLSLDGYLRAKGDSDQLRAQINGVIKGELMKREIILFEDVDPYLSLENDGTGIYGWYVADDGLHIFYNIYSIAPYAEGMIDIAVGDFDQ